MPTLLPDGQLTPKRSMTHKESVFKVVSEMQPFAAAERLWVVKGDPAEKANCSDSFALPSQY